MAFATTPRKGLRPSLASSPNLHATSQSQIAARKASLNALVGGPTTPTNKMGGDGQEIEVGDLVDVPGGMHGVVKFIGSVRGKKGIFGGVELSKEFAARGKNDGDVDGYVQTSGTYLGFLAHCALGLDISRPLFQVLASSSHSTEPSNVHHFL